MRSGNSAQYSAGFITGFVGFRLRNRIKYHASTGLHGGDTVFHQRRADHYAGVEIAMRGEITYRAAVAAAATASAPAINCMARTFGAPLNVPIFIQAR
ncbi:Uncharacterised protein [Escherichia coli]|uniref:Uncharacterized protein n=1 Tax=Escherichia coli TaxID=562 RepID=A0A377D3V4_ECOLX|nr:Uncharacterised protein [Escherichia coli]